MKGARLLLGLLLPLLFLACTTGLDCPLDLTREARALVSGVVPLVPNFDELPATCILRPDNDIQRRAEALLEASRELSEPKRLLDSPQWLCPICSAEQKANGAPRSGSFTATGYWSEVLLERHLWQKHSAQIGRNSPTEVCLADFCDVLGCPSWLRAHPNFDCDVAAAKTRLAKCKQVFAQCFPPEANPASLALYQTVTDTFCRHEGCHSTLQPAISVSSQDRFISSSTLFYVLIVGLAIFYFFYWRKTRHTVRSSDFVSRTRRASQSTWSSFGSKKNPI